MKSSNITPWIAKPAVAEEVYTDRIDFIDYFYNAALQAARRRTMSTVLLGQRRMGKTEIFKRVVNRLFFEQDPRDPGAVVPVYYSFEDEKFDNKSFAMGYLENFLRHYVGFYTGQPELISDKISGDKLLSLVEKSRSLFPFSRMLDLILDKHEEIEHGYLPHKTALHLPRMVSDIDDSTIVMFLDEFQNTWLPQYDFRVVGFMQEAVESPTCPHFVTGSAMSILAREIIGRGSLFGRFDGREIKAMTEYWGAQLALRAAHYYGAEVPELMAPVLADRCGGNPFYITAVVRRAAVEKKVLSNEKILNEVLAVDLSSGFIWGELNDQVSRWIERLNEFKITKWILYLSALEEEERISLERIQRELKEREGQSVSLDTIRDVLIKLSRGDLLEYLELGGWFRKVKDPILLEFLKIWGKIEVEGYSSSAIVDDLVSRYSRLKRKFSEYQGYVAEVFMAQALLSSQRKTLPGRFFHSAEDIVIPHQFFYVEYRVRPGSGKGREIDIIAAAGPIHWVCESKWVKGKKAGKREIESIIEKAQAWNREKNRETIVMWLFSHDGLTQEAQGFAKDKGVLWSDRKDLDELLAYLGLRQLPDVE